jgi:hypothetical protein
MCARENQTITTEQTKEKTHNGENHHHSRWNRPSKQRKQTIAMEKTSNNKTSVGANHKSPKEAQRKTNKQIIS